MAGGARTLAAHRPVRTGPTESILSTYLDALLDHARERVSAARARRSDAALREAALAVPAGPSLRAALAVEGVSVLAEIKRASPSKGPIRPDLDAVVQAEAYRRGGAAGVSVLTEPSRFSGQLGDLAAVAALGVPALRKDFIVDPYQIWEAREAGAAAVLLIVAALEAEQLAELHAEARSAGLDVLVEVHDAAEVAVTHTIGAQLVGVNARDLRTFEVDTGAFARLREELPAGALAVAESGISSPEDVRAVAGAGADAVLVGESLVRAADPAAAVAALVAAGRAAEGGSQAAGRTAAVDHQASGRAAARDHQTSARAAARDHQTSARAAGGDHQTPTGPSRSRPPRSPDVTTADAPHTSAPAPASTDATAEGSTT